MIDPMNLEITRLLLMALGIDIQSGTNILIDQETKNQIAFDGKIIKATVDPNNVLYVSENDVILEPLNPKCTRIVQMLFGKFLKDEASEDMGAPEASSFGFINPAPKMYKLVIIYEDGTKWEEGGCYLNARLCYIDAIFRIRGGILNEYIPILKQYDIDFRELERR